MKTKKMAKIVIEGGIPLKGSVKISGAKNSALPLMAASLLTSGKCILYNVPRLKDVDTMKDIMREMGVQFIEKNTLLIDSTYLRFKEAPYELVRQMRASILLLGPLLARHGRARIALPGGCAIGARPVNLHLSALSAMGAEIDLDKGYIDARANRLKGADIFFDIPTVTGTENVMMAATLAEGKTIIRNAAKEPEIVDLANMLRSMGAYIRGDGTDTIVIDGVKELYPAEHRIIPDRIEAGTFMIASAMTRGEVEIKDCRPEHLGALIEKLEKTGAEIKIKDEVIFVKGPDRIRSVDIKTMPFPGFPTDLQAQFMAMMCIADGCSVIKETIFENRFIHVGELRRMGADIEVNGSQATVKGRKRLLAAPVVATDLRASASLILAGLVAEEGRTEVYEIHHLDRGYEALEKKFASLGAKIWRES